jgi:hypothetical protein
MPKIGVMAWICRMWRQVNDSNDAIRASPHPTALQRLRKNCFEAVVPCVRYADLENHLLVFKGGRGAGIASL